MSFEIHPQLLADCYRLGRFELCHVLLHRNAVLPWFVLVPETRVAGLFDLPKQERNAALDEAALVSQFVKQELGYPKINFAAIGNVVPQLHLHVVGRKPGDACWPAPVWGHLSDGSAYPVARLAEVTDALVRGCALRRV
ncbi:MAG: HIT family protein [Deltaproteobacteria bacterium]|nr:HIT family protein [Deltaproteobacteria bacterium]